MPSFNSDLMGRRGVINRQGWPEHGKRVELTGGVRFVGYGWGAELDANWIATGRIVLVPLDSIDYYSRDMTSPR